MTTKKEILSFLKKDQEARAAEKEQEKIDRAKERKEDREHFLSVITALVDKKVKAALDPIENKLGQQEKVNKELYIKVQALGKEVKNLKQESKSQQQAFPQ